MQEREKKLLDVLESEKKLFTDYIMQNEEHNRKIEEAQESVKMLHHEFDNRFDLSTCPICGGACELKLTDSLKAYVTCRKCGLEIQRNFTQNDTVRNLCRNLMAKQWNGREGANAKAENKEKVV